MANITFDLAGASVWCYGDETFPAGRHEVDADPDLAAAIAAAGAAGVLKVIDGQVPAVEDDEESLAKQEVALAARAGLYEQRDRELAAIGPDDPDAREAALDEWEQRMAEASQEALEE